MSNNSFIKYTVRLGYPERLGRDAVARLGERAATNELLSAVLAEATRSNIRPCNTTYSPTYLNTQDSYRLKDGSSKRPQWNNIRKL